MFVSDYLCLELGNFSSHKGLRVGSGNIGNSAQFVLILQIGKYLSPRTPLKFKCGPPPYFTTLETGRLIGSK